MSNNQIQQPILALFFLSVICHCGPLFNWRNFFFWRRCSIDRGWPPRRLARGSPYHGRAGIYYYCAWARWGSTTQVGDTMYVFHFFIPLCKTRTTLDIIVLLVLGVAFVVAFFLWQSYLERVQNNPNISYSLLSPPPLMKVSLWKRSKGRFAIIMFITFLTWCSFLSWAFWVQVFIFLVLRLELFMTFNV